MSFWRELSRRNVVRVAAAYAVAGWLLVQVADTVLPIFEAPGWVLRVFTFFVILGFPLALILSWAYELTPDGIKRSKDVPAMDSITRATGQRLNFTVTGLLALAVAYMAIERYALEDSAGAAEERQANTAVSEIGGAPAAVEQASEMLPNSVAVLLCDNFSTDPENGFFAASLHEELLNQLVKLRELNVIARTSVLQYANGDRPSITDIANELRVGAVIECSVAYGDGRIVISVQLIDGESGVHIWSERYNREFKDVFGIQADIAMNVANALAVEFSGEEQRAIEQPPTDSPEAYALYLKALSLSNVDNAGLLALLEQALTFDPDFALAHRAKAAFHSTALINTTGLNAVSSSERDEQMRLARFHAARAVAIEPSLAWLEHAVGSAATWRWSEALQAADTAPDPLQQDLIWVLAYAGESDKAIARARRWMELDPRNPIAVWTLATVFAYAGDMAESERLHGAAIEMAPTAPIMRSWLAFVEIALGNTEAGVVALQRAEQLLGQNRSAVFLPELAYLYSRLGRERDVARLVAEIEQSPGIEIGAGGWAMVELARGDTAGASARLEQAIAKIGDHQVDEGFFNLMNLRMNISRDPLLEAPPFVELRSRLQGD